MKIKKTFLTLVGATILLTFILSSCCSTNNVVSSNLIQKRKYNHGYFVNIFSKKPEVSKIQVNDNKKTIDPVNSQITGEAITETKNKSQREIQPNNFSDIVANTDSAAVSKQKQTKDQFNKPVSSDEKNIRKSQSRIKLEKIINTIKRKSFNSFLIDKPDEAPKVNPNALAGFICGLTAMFLLMLALLISSSNGGLAIVLVLFMIACAICAITFSIIGKRRIKKHPEMFKGKGFAIAGLVLGLIETGLLVLTLLWVVFFLLLLEEDDS
jgi:VIT1/CCC1 family predicted Fe2+/Mn2+ transporter